MSRFNATSEGNVPFTAEEEARWDARRDAYAVEQAALAKTEYQRDRAAAYPPIGDQLDALFKAGVFPADMAAALQAVKDKYPKG
tara:strand:- start:1592 stop:1843 length:252 start_codon:yes stop_codon:yes gene_type:complete